jgi:hypothetical protein
MSGTNQDSASESTAVQVEASGEIRIVRLNLDKTRRINGSFTGYQAYFELSETPSSAWRDIFGLEWKDLNPTQKACIDGRFLVMHCPLLKIVLHLPVMKRAVTATNIAYRRYAQEQKTEQDYQGDAREEERKTLEDIARSLNFG